MVHFERGAFVLQKCNSTNSWSVWDIYKSVCVFLFIYAYSLPIRNIYSVSQ